ncbi:MAG TPA: hypothetical protein VF790_00160 [Dissulfurispiraceae bacterium]
MKDIIVLQEKLQFVEQEVKTLTEKTERLKDRLDESLRETADLRTEMKGLMIFLGRIHPHFRAQFPEIVAKLDD